MPDLPFTDKGSFKPREIVAGNLGPDALSRAKALGFTEPQQTLLGNLGLGSVQRLVLPPGMGEQQAYTLLRARIPEGLFGANHLFRILPAAEDGAKGAVRQAALPPGQSKPCTGEKCFGQSLIGWTSENRTCARKMRIGVIDTSFDLSHPAFAGHRFQSGNFLQTGEVSEHDWHGTAVLALLAGDNRSGTPGLVPDAEFFLASAFRTDADGSATADTMSVLNALSWLETSGVRIVNMSFSGPPDAFIEKAIFAMRQRGTIFVAAAGNRGPDAPPSYPAAYPDVIAVTAIGQTRQSYRNANHGDYVDAAAPGVGIWTALPNGKEGYRTGTSFSAPYMTGILASMPLIKNGKPSKAEILANLAYDDLGAPGRDPIFGYGLAKAPERCAAAPEVAHKSVPDLPWMGVGAGDVQPAIRVKAPDISPAAAAFGPASQ